MGAPIPFLVASGTLMDEPVGWYPREAATEWFSLLPGFAVITVEDVNHDTILIAEKRADAPRTGIQAEQSRISAAHAATEVHSDNGQNSGERG